MEIVNASILIQFVTYFNSEKKDKNLMFINMFPLL